MKYLKIFELYFQVNRIRKIVYLSIFVVVGGMGMLLVNLISPKTYFIESDINVVSGASSGSKILGGLSGLDLGRTSGDFMELENLPLLIRSRLVLSELMRNKIAGESIFNLMCEAKGIRMSNNDSRDSIELILHEKWIKDVMITRLSKESNLLRIRYESSNKNLVDSLLKKLLPTVLSVYNTTSEKYNLEVVKGVNKHIDSVRFELVKIENRLLDVKEKNDFTVSHLQKERQSKLETEKLLLLTLYGELIKTREMKYAIQKSKISEFQEVNYLNEARVKKRSKKIDLLVGFFVGGFLYFIIFPLKFITSNYKNL